MTKILLLSSNQVAGLSLQNNHYSLWGEVRFTSDYCNFEFLEEPETGVYVTVADTNELLAGGNLCMARFNKNDLFAGDSIYVDNSFRKLQVSFCNLKFQYWSLVKEISGSIDHTK